VCIRIPKSVMLPEPSHPIATYASRVRSRRAIDKLVMLSVEKIVIALCEWFEFQCIIAIKPENGSQILLDEGVDQYLRIGLEKMD
jgi:hypothetical protein